MYAIYVCTQHGSRKYLKETISKHDHTCATHIPHLMASGTLHEMERKLQRMRFNPEWSRDLIEAKVEILPAEILREMIERQSRESEYAEIRDQGGGLILNSPLDSHTFEVASVEINLTRAQHEFFDWLERSGYTVYQTTAGFTAAKLPKNELRPASEVAISRLTV